jgi:hypothetical protein
MFEEDDSCLNGGFQAIKNAFQQQREKYINVYIYGIEKKGTEEPICREGRETDPEKDLWTKLGEGVVG